jgi:thioredoxin 1
MSEIKRFEASGFEADVLKSEQPVLVDFYADWCGPCKMVAPVVEKIAQDYAGRLVVGKLDVDESPDIASRYGIMGIPTLGLYMKGEMVDRLVGFSGPTALRHWLEVALDRAAAA